MNAHPTAATTHDKLYRRDDVMAHLAFAAATIRDAQILVDGNAISCKLGFPHADDLSQTIELALAPIPLPPSGTVVQVRYTHGQASYQYLSSIRATPQPNRWRLAAPGIVEREERRIADRIDVSREPTVALTVTETADTHRQVALCDLSSGGASFEVPTSLAWARPGNVQSATLQLGGNEVLPIRIEVRHCRARVGQHSQVVGVRFNGLTPTESRRIAIALERLNTN